MKRLGIALILLGSFLGSAKTASASIPGWALSICKAEVPQVSRFILPQRDARKWIRDLPAGVIAVVGPAVGNSHHEVFVRAPKGSEFDSGAGTLVGACGYAEAVVSTTRTARLPAPGIIESKVVSSFFQIRWRGVEKTGGNYGPVTAALFWTRVDIAKSAKDLETGRFRSRFGMRDASFRADSSSSFHYHVRLVRFLPDGSEQIWKGWVRLRDGKVTFGGAPVQRSNTALTKRGRW